MDLNAHIQALKQRQASQRENYIQQVNIRLGKREPKAVVVSMATNVDGEIPDEFGCPICLGYVYQPKTCSECQNNIYCSGCVKDLRACPMCKGGKFVDSNRLIVKLLNNSLVKCNFPMCSKKNETMCYSEFVSKHADECQQFNMACPLNCDLPVHFGSLDDALKHYDVCPKVIEYCERCEEAYDRCDYLIHLDHDCNQTLLEKQVKITQEQEQLIKTLRGSNQELRQTIRDVNKSRQDSQDQVAKLLERVLALEASHKTITTAIGQYKQQARTNEKETMNKSSPMKRNMQEEEKLQEEGDEIVPIDAPIQVDSEYNYFKAIQTHQDWSDSVNALANKLHMTWRNARVLHCRYQVKSGDQSSQAFLNAVNAIEYVKDKKYIEDSNIAYKILASAQFKPIAA